MVNQEQPEKRGKLGTRIIIISMILVGFGIFNIVNPGVDPANFREVNKDALALGFILLSVGIMAFIAGIIAFVKNR